MRNNVGSLFSSGPKGPTDKEIKAKDEESQARKASSFKEGLADARQTRVTRDSLVQPGLYIPPAN